MCALAEFFTELAKAAGGDRWGEWERYDEIEEEEENIFALLEWCFESGESRAGLQLTKGIIFFLSTRGYVYEAKKIGYEAVTIARVNSQIKDLAWLLIHCVGWFEVHAGDLEKGEQHIREGLSLFESLNDLIGMRSGFYNLGTALYFKYDFKGSRTNYEKGLLLAESLDKEKGGFIFRGWLAVLDAAEGKLTKAQKGLELVVSTFGDREILTLPSFLAHLAKINAQLGNYDAALELGHKALAMANKMKKRTTIAWISWVLSCIENDCGNYYTAHAFANQALEFYESSSLFAGRIDELKAHIKELQKKL